MPTITALTNYAAINSVSDVLPIVDITNNETKKIAMSVLMGLITDTTTTWKFSISGTTLVLNNGSNRIGIDAAGKVGIGTITPAFQLDLGILGDVRAHGYFLTNGAIESSANDLRIASIDDILLQSPSGTTLMFIENTGNVGIGITTPNANALLDITSTTKAFMPPRMTTVQKNAIAAPTSGMVVYDSTLNKLCVYGAAAWETITSV